MRKFQLLWAFILVISIQATQAQQGNFIIQVGSFERPVKPEYFAGIGNVSYVKDHNDFHRYFLLGYGDMEEVTAKMAELKGKGYKPVMIDLDIAQKNCKLSCNKDTMIDLRSIKWVFFEFNSAELKTESKEQLDKLGKILKDNPQYYVELSGHTDSKGSNDYNLALSHSRANSAMAYVIEKGTTATRIRVASRGESSPIAKNVLGKADSELGRQFNRRVEIRVYDAKGRLLNFIESPEIPDELKQKNFTAL
jgi:outer membrane protein OmpA-like peptidoglycan-associated protein